MSNFEYLCGTDNTGIYTVCPNKLWNLEESVMIVIALILIRQQYCDVLYIAHNT